MKYKNEWLLWIGIKSNESKVKQSKMIPSDQQEIKSFTFSPCYDLAEWVSH